MELLHDPDAVLSSEDFRAYYPNVGNLPLHSFSDDDLALRYSEEYRLCVFDDQTQECVYCKRADH